MRLILLVLLLSGCVSFRGADAADADYLPDPAKTPGAIMASCTLDDAKADGYTASVRNVPQSLAKAVYASYGLAAGQGKCALDEHNQGCEVDHLVSLLLCGDNVQDNLWIQSYHGPCNAHDKDALEVRLHKMIRDGTISLQDAQQAIRSNWIAAYRTYVGPLDCGEPTITTMSR